MADTVTGQVRVYGCSVGDGDILTIVSTFKPFFVSVLGNDECIVHGLRLLV